MTYTYSVQFDIQKNCVLTHYDYKVIARNTAEAKTIVSVYMTGVGCKSHLFHLEAHRRPADWVPEEKPSSRYGKYTYVYHAGDLTSLDNRSTIGGETSEGE